MNATATTTTLLDAARRYHAAGFSILPIQRGEKKPAEAIGKWERFKTERADLVTVNRWFANGAYDAIGIVTGDVSGGLVILDFDGEGWERARDDLLEAFPALANTRHVKTGSGRLHIWLKFADLRNGGDAFTQAAYRRPDLGEKTAIEVRANTVQTLAPPSRHPSGGVYEFANDAPVIETQNLHALLDWLEDWQATATATDTTPEEAPKKRGRPEKEKVVKPTDDQLAARWVEKQAGRVIFGIGDYWGYERGYWQKVHADQVKQEIMDVCTAARFEGVAPSSYTVSSVREMARLMIRTPDEYFNANAGALVLRNGTLDIDALTLREHDPADYATIALDYDYDPTATAPIFEYCLQSTIPDAAGFLQEFAGYCLTDDTSFETAVWLYGPRGSGKSTLLHGFQTMLGAMVGLLGLAQIERSQFALASLPGKRLMLATEQPGGYLSAAWVLNAIISGEPVPIEQKHKDAYTFKPFAKIAWAMNDLPRIGDAADGLFRRVKVVKFPALAEEDRDPTFRTRISQEAPGILNWALAGLRRLRGRGRFDVPESVKTATDNFQRENDKAALFIEECCDIDKQRETSSKLLYEAYRQWCFTNEHRPESSTRMGREWARLGFEKKHKDAGNAWDGVGFPKKKPESRQN